MALETVVYPQDPLGYICCKDGLIHDYFFEDQDQEHKSLLGALNLENHTNAKVEQEPVISYHDIQYSTQHHQWDGHFCDTNGNDNNQSPLTPLEGFDHMIERPAPPASIDTAALMGHRKRRRTRSSKNKEEIENQRMTHIAVERNRRKQMNEHLAVLRSLMPPSYAQRGDQASIIGGAINFVKELEQLLQSIEANKKRDYKSDNNFSSPFAKFFTLPQYSTRCTTHCSTKSPPLTGDTASADSATDIEVTLVDSHANIKILAKKRPRQLLKLVAGLQGLRLAILHLNLTAVDRSVLYTVSVKVEDGSQQNTVDDITAAVNQILRRIEEEAAFG